MFKGDDLDVEIRLASAREHISHAIWLEKQIIDNDVKRINQATLKLYNEVGKAYKICRSHGGISSCMTGEGYTHSLTLFYVRFGAVCAVLELDEKPIARCLYWTGTMDEYDRPIILIDRVYTSGGEIAEKAEARLNKLLTDYTNSHFPGIKIIYHQNIFDSFVKTKKITVDNWWEIMRLPYVDTLHYLNEVDGEIWLSAYKTEQTSCLLNLMAYTDLETLSEREDTVWSRHESRRLSAKKLYIYRILTIMYRLAMTNMTILMSVISYVKMP